MPGIMEFSHAVGYRGLASIKPHGDEEKTTLLCTGGNINLTQDPIMSGGVWGAGYANAAPIAYAFNYLSLEGSMNFEWVEGIWESVKKFAISDRTAQHHVELLPDGLNGFKGNGWCSSLSFDASESAALTGSMNFKGDPSDEEGGVVAGSTDYTSKGAGTPTDPQHLLVGNTLIAYWQTTVRESSDVSFDQTGASVGSWRDMKDIINWSCSYNSDLQVLKCCNYQDTAPIAPDYILCGEMSGEGSYTIFKIQNNFSPSSYHNVRALQFQIGASHLVTIPSVLISSGSTAMATGASYITCDYSFTAIGDGVNSIIKMD